MDKFQKDLATGHEYEKRSLLYLDYDEYEFKEGYFKEYDLIITKNGKKTTIEVKSDKQASLTGNLAIEYKCSGKPSGITSTTADYWIYFIVYEDKEECYKIPTEELRKIVKTQGRKVSGGDGNRSRLYLVNKSLVSEFLVKPKKLDLINFKNKNITYYIKPTMSDQEAKTEKPLSYTQRLIKEFSTDKTYDFEEIKQVIESFSKAEYEKKKANYKVLPFGKYKYKKVEDIAKIDAQYLKWCLKQSFMDNYEELKEEINRHL